MDRNLQISYGSQLTNPDLGIAADGWKPMDPDLRIEIDRSQPMDQSRKMVAYRSYRSQLGCSPDVSFLKW